MSKVGTERMWILRHHDSLASNRRAVTQPVPPLQLLESQAIITSAERSAAFVFSFCVAARYLWHRLGPRSFSGRGNGPGAPAAEPRRLFPSRCSNSSNARSNALDAPSRRSVGAASWWRGFSAARVLPARVAEHIPIYASPLLRRLHDSGTSWGASKHPAGFPGAREVRAILQEPHPRAA